MTDDIYDDGLVDDEADDESLANEEILQAFGLDPYPADFESMVEFAQKGARAIFMSQLAICLRNYRRCLRADQDDYEELNSMPSGAMTAMKTATDIFRSLTGYDAGIDPSRAIELLERMGYEVSGGSAFDESPSNISDTDGSDRSGLTEE